MLNRKVLWLVFLASLLAGPVMADETITLAILPLENLRPEEGSFIGSAVAEDLSSSLRTVQGVTLVERLQLSRVLDEQDLGLFAGQAERKAATLGRLLAADQIIVGSYLIEKGQIQFNLRIVDVKTAKRIESISLRYDRDKLLPAMDALRNAVSKSLGLPVAPAVMDRRKSEPVAREDGQSDDVRQSLPSSTWGTEISLAYEYLLRSRQRGISAKEEIRWLDKAIRLDSRFGLAYNRRALVYLKIGRADDALSDLSMAIRYMPDRFVALTNRARLYCSLGRYREALRDADEAVRQVQAYGAGCRVADAGESFATRAEAFLGLRRWSSAVRDLGRAIELTPHSVDLGLWYSLRGYGLGMLGNHRKAEQDFTVAIRLSRGQDGKALVNRASARAILGDSRGAWQDVTAAREMGYRIPSQLLARLEPARRRPF
jgi:TolB-like protein/Flp pilus assembly protein TadD